MAQSPNGAPSAPAEVTDAAAELDALRKATEADQALSPEVRASITTALQQAASFRQQAAQAEAAIAALGARVDAAPERIKTLRAQIDAPAAPMEDLQNATIEQVQPRFRELEIGLVAAREALRSAEDALSAHITAATEASDLISDRRARLEKLEQERKAPLVAGEAAPVTRSRQLALDARQALRTAELRLYELRQTHRDSLQELLGLERDMARKSLERTQARVERLQTMLQNLRESEAEQARREAETQRVTASALPESIRAVADTNLELTRELERITRAEAEASEALLAAEQRSNSIKVDFEATRQRVELVGSSPAIGRLLRRRLASLPSTDVYRRTSAQRRSTIEASTERQIDLDELARAMPDPEIQAATLVQAVTPPVSAEQRETLTPRAVELLTKTKALMHELHRLHGRYVARLTALDAAERDLVKVASGYVSFAKEHLTWIPSVPRLEAGDLAETLPALAVLFGPQTWRTAGVAIADEVKGHPMLAAVGVALVLALMWMRQRGRKALSRLAEVTRRIRTDSFAHTLMALFHTLGMALAGPTAALLVVVALAQGPTPSISDRLAQALLAANVAWFTLGLLRFVCVRDGLAERHFGWPDRVRQQLSRALGWLLVFVPALAFVFTFASSSPDLVDLVSVGRPAFIALMLVVLVFLLFMFRGKGALVAAMSRSALGRSRVLWLALLLAAPVLLAGIAGFGYLHTATQFFTRIEATVWVLIALLLLRDLVLRAFYVTERRLRFEEALRLREEARAQRESDSARAPDAGSSAVSEIANVEIEEVNFRDLGEQAQRLVRIGLVLGALAAVWAVWQDFLPALGFLGRFELPLTAVELVDGVERQVPVTLADLGLALLILGLVFIAAKNLPGLLEIAVLQRLPIEAGARYAIVTLCQYAIVAVGVVVTFSTIGLQWSSIQWLVAALSVGLGFGLQEIVANFISGIILLLERPIRVGDVVTVGDTTGTVTRIRIRATTITNYDRQELLVPNKEFITGRLLNWTLSDRMNRIFLPVGVAYGADVDRAIELIVEAANECEAVLDTPAPSAVFESFGDSSLLINLRCFLSSLDQRLVTIGELHRRINRKLEDAGIGIAFPQQDTHMHFMGPLQVQMARERRRDVPGGSGSDAGDAAPATGG